MGAADQYEQDQLTLHPSGQRKGQRKFFWSTLHRWMPEAREKISAAAALLSLCAIGLSFWTLHTTLHQNKAANAVSVAATFSTLRSHYHAVDADLPTNYRKEDARYQQDSEDWRRVKRYWDISFDEWFVSNELHADGEVRDLWKDFYAEAIGLSLRLPAMRAVYCDLDYRTGDQTTIRHRFHVAIAEEFTSLQLGISLCPVPRPNKAHI